MRRTCIICTGILLNLTYYTSYMRTKLQSRLPPEIEGPGNVPAHWQLITFLIYPFIADWFREWGRKWLAQSVSTKKVPMQFIIYCYFLFHNCFKISILRLILKSTKFGNYIIM